MDVRFHDTDAAHEALIALRERMANLAHEMRTDPNPVIREIAKLQYERTRRAAGAFEEALGVTF